MEPILHLLHYYVDRFIGIFFSPVGQMQIDDITDVDWAGEIDKWSQSDQSYGFRSQTNTTDDGYVLVYDREQQHEQIMGRKIGGALNWSCSAYQHMQNVPTLTFSVQLGCTYAPDDIVARDLFLNQLPNKLQASLQEEPERSAYYNRWLFSYAE